MLKRNRAFFEDSELLVAQGHVVHRQQEDKLVMLVLTRLNLIQHCLRLLKENESFLEAFL